MPIINSEIDRRSKKEVFFAEGVVEFVKLDKFPETKVSYIRTSGQPDKKVEATHRASILLKEKGASREDQGQWIGLGDVKLNPQHENLQIKAEVDGQPEAWITIERGVEVTMDLKVDEYNGKTYYNSSKGKITIRSIEGVAPKSAPANKPSENQASYKKKDNSGVESGHAVNGALYLQRNGVAGDAVSLAKIVHSATVTLKEEVAKARGVPVTDYDTGAAVGHAILNACRDADANVSGESLIASAKETLKVSDEVLAFIKSGSKAPEVKKPATPSKPTKPATVVDTPPMDFDSDIPF